MTEANKRPPIRKEDLLYPDLSYQINGALFSVFRQLGPGLLEQHYQKATAFELEERGIQHVQQFYVPLHYKDKFLGKRYVDFLIEGIIVVELKKGQFIPVQTIRQAHDYLQLLNLKLALIACFTNRGVHIKRVVNI